MESNCTSLRTGASRFAAELNREAVVLLANYRHSVPAADLPLHGRSLVNVIGSYAPSRRWLQAALLAGFVPDTDGIELAVHGVHLEILELMAESEVAGEDGDATAWTFFADSYRHLIRVLEEQVAELESQAARLYRKPCRDRDDRTVLDRMAASADHRALRASLRKAMVESEHAWD